MDTVSEAAVYLRFGLTKAHQGAIEEKDTYVQQMKQRGVFDARPSTTNIPITLLQLLQHGYMLASAALQAQSGDEPIVWSASARSTPTTRHPVTLYAGNLVDGSICTIPGRCTLGFIHDLAMLSPDYVTAVLTSVTCGSARRGGLDWGGVPLGADWPSALLTHDIPGTAVLTEVQMATLLCDKAKLFFSMYRARTLPVEGVTSEGPALAKGVPAMKLDADTGLLHCRDGRRHRYSRVQLCSRVQLRRGQHGRPLAWCS